MYKLMIVDDDPWVLQWLGESINWKDCGFSYIREAVNGYHAMALIDEDQPDIVITDIKMDKMDGIELLTQVREKYPGIRVILLSGYHEFEYARAAIKKGAVDYLLKPIEENELISLVKRTLMELQSERANKEREQKIAEQLEQSIPILQENFIKELLSGNIPELDILKSELSSRNISIDFSAYYILVMEIDNFVNLKGLRDPETLKNIKRNQKSSVESFLNQKGKCVSFYENDQLVIGFSPRSEESMSGIGLICEKIRKETGNTASIGVSKLKKDVSLAHEAYIEAYEALKRKFYFGTNQIIFADNIGMLSKSNVFEVNRRDQLLNYLDTGNHEKASRLLKEIFAEINEKKISYDMLHLNCVRIISVLNDAMERAGFSQDTLAYNGFDMNIKLEDFETVDELQSRFQTLLIKAIDIINGKGNKRSRKIIEDAIAFIHENIKEEISLDIVAKKLYINPAYLSRLFKDEVGKTFTHFLMKTRVEKAKELLKESYLKIYEISEQVGYKNEKYFSRIFKDFEGITPNEYRDRIPKS